ncbi:MAG: hypothetical protein KTR31_13390 [Myxococcales bacterium]|nr:hypothetical protein [Myxococcales bacterium]
MCVLFPLAWSLLTGGSWAAEPNTGPRSGHLEGRLAGRDVTLRLDATPEGGLTAQMTVEIGPRRVVTDSRGRWWCGEDGCHVELVETQGSAPATFRGRWVDDRVEGTVEVRGKDRGAWWVTWRER